MPRNPVEPSSYEDYQQLLRQLAQPEKLPVNSPWSLRLRKFFERLAVFYVLRNAQAETNKKEKK